MPPPFTWPFAIVFWPTYLWAFYPEIGLIRRARLTGPLPPEDRSSARIVFLAVNVIMNVALACAFLVPKLAVASGRTLVLSLGVALMIAGSLLRRHCFRVLGASVTGAITVRPDQEVVARGAYRWVRHPSYTGAILLLDGIGMALGNWLSFGIVAGASLLLSSYRAHVEEKALLSGLGEPYRAFLTTRKRFFPYVY